MISAQTGVAGGSPLGLGPAKSKPRSDDGGNEAFGRTLEDSMGKTRPERSGSGALKADGADKAEKTAHETEQETARAAAGESGSEKPEAAEQPAPEPQDVVSAEPEASTALHQGDGESATGEEEGVGTEVPFVQLSPGTPKLPSQPGPQSESVASVGDSAALPGANPDSTVEQAIAAPEPALALAAQQPVSAATTNEPVQAEQGGKPLPAVAAVIAALQSGQGRPGAKAEGVASRSGAVVPDSDADVLSAAGRSVLSSVAPADDDTSPALREVLSRMAGGSDAAGKAGVERGAAAGAEFRQLLARTTAESLSSPVTSTPTPTAAQGAVTPAPVGTPVTAALAIPVPVKQSGWDQAMGERVIWMTRQGIQEAQIQLNPRNLGPIDVKVSVQNDQASVSFTVQHGATREALEAAMPRLRDMFGEQGLQLAQSDVQHRDGTAGREGSGGEKDGIASHDPATDGESEPEVPVTTLSSSGDGLVDYFA